MSREFIHHVQRVSRLLQPIKSIPKGGAVKGVNVSRSYQTYEESITSLIADVKPQKSNLPLLLYQISNKWRDEMKPRLGLFRGREFVMKDLYSFDASTDSAERTYETVAEAYRSILDHIGVPYSIVEGDTGIMGGIISHEYHYLADIGEDTVVACNACDFRVNSVIYNGETCKKCGGEVTKKSAIEIAHTFLLGTKYSEVLQATVHTQEAEIPLVMGCYGLGLTRLLAASLEVLSTNEDLRWPKALAPYTVCVIPPKENSKESPAAHFADEIVENLVERNIDVIFDDRTQLTIGRRMLDAKRTGYPYVLVVGRYSMQENPLFELHDVNEGQRQDVSLDQLYNFFDNSESMKQIRSQIAA
ncbi:probable proline--tRNA ligase, mitochondrial isoform X2 [Diachasma alloeum]|uniref:probable proline--tRNA ligase, mitochondrial isoform X2 n=1 Tax=Diachasma alloeum TaxID=454923 RepID=UPI000738299C|nr:probable proline--tRNA ligase, mitochondrial isoform X2 [Diachasma alloeum]